MPRKTPATHGAYILAGIGNRHATAEQKRRRVPVLFGVSPRRAGIESPVEIYHRVKTAYRPGGALFGTDLLRLITLDRTVKYMIKCYHEHSKG